MTFSQPEAGIKSRATARALRRFFGFLALILASVIVALSGCSAARNAGAEHPVTVALDLFDASDVSDTYRQHNETQVSSLTPDPEEDPLEGLRHASVFILGVRTAKIGKTLHEFNIPPFLNEGVMFVPLKPVVVLLGGSMAQKDDVYFVNYNGNVSILMEEYNVFLFNTVSHIMDCRPVLRDGDLCVSVDALAVMLSKNCSKSPSQQLCVLGADKQLDVDAMARIREGFGLEKRPELTNTRLSEIAQAHGMDYDELARAAVYRHLWVSDSQGRITALWLDDSNELREYKYVMTEVFPKDSVFVAKEENWVEILVDMSSKKRLPKFPDELYKEELRWATGRYMELLASFSLLGDREAERLLPSYRRALQGELTAVDYVADRRHVYETGLFTEFKDFHTWEVFVRNAEVGDFIVFSAEKAAAEYGYFNHAALIIDIDRDKKCLRLLQARGSEYGVGADLEMDYLSWQSLEDEEFFCKYGTLFLCGVEEFSQARRERMVSWAYEKYNGYQFGYGGRVGLEEINCAELVVSAYRHEDIDLVHGNYESRLKDVLKGNTKNFVLIPDDLLFSEVARVKAVWTR